MKSFILIIWMLAAFVGCAHTEQGKNAEHPDAVLIPDELQLTKSEIVDLKRASGNGNCDASYRLYEYYAFCTSDQVSALEFAELALKQGCDHVEEEIKAIKDALGETSN